MNLGIDCCWQLLLIKLQIPLFNSFHYRLPAETHIAGELRARLLFKRDLCFWLQKGSHSLTDGIVFIVLSVTMQS